MFEKLKFWAAIAIAALLLVYILPVKNLLDSSLSVFSAKNDMSVNLSLVNPEIKVLAAEPSNKLILQADVKNLSGMPVPNADVKFSVDKDIGEIYPSEFKTNKYGQCIVAYMPPSYGAEQFRNGNIDVKLNAAINKTGAAASVKIALTGVPVIFVHGYQANGGIFENLRDFLFSKGIDNNAISYKSENGVASSAKELNAYLLQQRTTYLSKGVQVKKFDLIAHSMGGLVARYYTCSDDYIRNENVRKLIFLSVPHQGSPWASIGLGYYNDQGIKDLVPDSELLSIKLPAMINNGLNNTIQVGNIMAQYDEVVSPESASLEKWNIKTELFNVGESSFTMENLLSGNLVEAANHRTILSNRKVYERVLEMLNHDLPYPALRK